MIVARLRMGVHKMKELNSDIESHYHVPKLFEDILGRLKEKGVDVDKVSRSDIASVDEFHLRGAEVSKELVEGINLNGLKVLDIGCGIGGPCRMLADEFDCKVTGIDVSQEYIRTAEKLSELVGLQDKTRFIQADALELPFDDSSFDVVWTQHVQMNINDKYRFYSEIGRVLTDKGTLIYHDIFRKDKEDVDYPVPWAFGPSVSFLQTSSNMDNILKENEFIKLTSTDQTGQAIQFLHNIFAKIKESGPPKLGLNVLMGDSTKVKLNNVLNGLEENKIVVQSGIYRK